MTNPLSSEVEPSYERKPPLARVAVFVSIESSRPSIKGYWAASGAVTVTTRETLPVFPAASVAA
jgi:hypothetical protein